VKRASEVGNVDVESSRGVCSCGGVSGQQASKAGSSRLPFFQAMLQRARGRCLGHPLDKVGSSAHVRFAGFRLLAPLAQTDTEETETDGRWDGTTVQQQQILLQWRTVSGGKMKQRDTSSSNQNNSQGDATAPAQNQTTTIVII
jgi:hypothetical protein